MAFYKRSYEALKTTVTYCLFGEEDSASEVHAILEPTDDTLHVEIQIHNLEKAIKCLFSENFPKQMRLVWKRYFVTDAANQLELIQSAENAATSVIQQPPLNGSKISLWIYGIGDAIIERKPDGAVCAKRPSYSHLFHTQLYAKKGDTFVQTTTVFNHYIHSLHNFGATLTEHCIRTWLFIQNIDVQYTAMVNARKQIFTRENLTSTTHYIASTGIEGRTGKPEVSVIMDAYTIPELKPEQIMFLKGSGYLNPTYEYGVTFERGTSIFYGDRQHVFISGTASINERGEITYLHDIKKQVQRVLENIEVLLSEAGCKMENLAYLIVYLRDVADYRFINAFMQDKFPLLPRIILLAPVCRPGWLIEIEGMAIRALNDARFKKF